MLERKLSGPGGGVRWAMRMRAIVLAACLAVWLAPGAARAQDLEPRSYANTPVGLNFVVAGYAYQQGDVVTDPGLPITDAKIHVHSSILAYARAFGLFGKSAKIDAIVPYSWVSGTASFQGQPQERIVDGFNDPRLRLSVNFYGAPALAMPEFLDYRQDLIIGASLQVVMPLGQYDGSRLINIGSNRWAFKPELGLVHPIGKWTLEAYVGGWFFTVNDDFFGGHRRAQDPILALQAHVIYTFLPGLWLSVDGTWYSGGDTIVDGVSQFDRQQNSRIGATAAVPLGHGHMLKVAWAKGASVRIGQDFSAVGLTYQYRWF